MRKLIVTVFLLSALFSTGVQAQGNTPADIIAADPNLSILLEAATAAGLDGALAGNVTVFAPTNGAFGTLLGELNVTREQLLADTATLQAVLRYHVVPGTFGVGDVRGAGSVDLTTASGEIINAAFVDNRLRLNNGRAIVVSPNRFGGVGVVHVVNNVLLPPTAPAVAPLADDTPQPPSVAPAPAFPSDTVLGLASRNADLSLFLTAVEAAGLTDTLNGEGPFTVFVPTNSAFETLLTDFALTDSSLLGDTTLLQSVLTYHVVPGRFSSAALVDLAGQGFGPVFNGRRLPALIPSQPTLPTVNGAPLAVAVDGGRVVLANGQATVIAADFSTGNGVVHLIDNVLLP